MSRQPLLIVGASGRAAAASALRAGFDPFVLDLFADADTQRLCPVRKLPMADYPHGFVALAKTLPPMPWMYTGGLENYPDVVAAISERRELWGNGPDVLAKVRDPLSLAEVLESDCGDSRNIAVPRTCKSSAATSPGVQWLRKPRHGAGGAGVRFATADDLLAVGPDAVLQEYIAGTPVSAVWASGSRGLGDWLGMTRQLIGEPWLHARPFQYCGNVGMHWPSKGALRDITLPLAIGRLVPLRGVWGIDFIDDGSRLHVLEVNPRYPASFELFEFRKGVAFLAHLGPVRFVPRWKVPPPPRASFGKAIYYAPHALTVPPAGPWDDALAHCTDVWRRPDFADIPHAGDVIDAGQPVLTILAEAATEAACEQRLQARAAELDRFFAG